jgi:hypothetical protein
MFLHIILHSKDTNETCKIYGWVTWWCTQRMDVTGHIYNILFIGGGLKLIKVPINECRVFFTFQNTYTLILKIILYVVEMHNTVTCRGVHVVKIMGSRSDEWIYWCSFTITLNSDSLHSLTVYVSLHSLLNHERLPLYYDKRRIPAHTLNCLEQRLSLESTLIHFWTSDFTSKLWTHGSFLVITVRRPWQQTLPRRVLFCSLRSHCVENRCNYHGNHICCHVFFYSITLKTCLANHYLAMANFTVGTMFTQLLAGNGDVLQLRYSGF